MKRPANIISIKDSHSEKQLIDFMGVVKQEFINQSKKYKVRQL
jgi:hypothetical protein